MNSPGRMVLADGTVMTRDEAGTSTQPRSPWDGDEIDDAAVTELTGEVVVLTDRGTGRRDDGDDFIVIITSTCVRDDGASRLAVYQQSPVA